MNTLDFTLADDVLHNPSGFHSIATACLRLGASCVRLLDDEKVMDVYPAGAEAVEPSLLFSARSGLTIQVYGVSHDWQSSLELAIELSARLLNTDGELEILTAALVETQDRLVALYDLSNATRRIFEIPVLLDLLGRETYRLLNAGSIFTMLLQPAHQAIVRQYGAMALPDAQIDELSTLYRLHPHNHVYKDAAALPPKINNLMMVPIPVREGLFAVLGACNKLGGFASPEIKLAQALAQQIGVQLENALLVQDTLARTRLETELTMARQVQMALLPQELPNIPNLDIYATSNPALEVGGDFFDLVAPPDRPLVMLLGDVTGKGMPAALLMSMTRTVARLAARHVPTPTPDQLMKRLNNDLLDDFSTVGMFTTVFIGILDPVSTKLTYCNAGQSPVFYMPATGKPVLLEAQDIPIGIFDGYDYTAYELSFSAGDILIISSDGFPEARNLEGEMFGYERMKDALLTVRNLSAKEMCETLFTTLRAFAGNHPQDDDQTIIIIKGL